MGIFIAFALVRASLGQCELMKILPSDGEPFDEFGNAVDIDGNVVIVGAHFEDEEGGNAGALPSYIFDGDSWVIVPDVIPDDDSDSTFGHSLCIDGTRLAAGRPGDNVNGSNSGSVYLFSFDGVEWIQEAKLVASDGQPDDDFGIDVSLDDDSLLVGSSGATYLFRFENDTWVERAKMQSSDGVPADEFGVSASLSGDVAIIGAKLNNDNGEFSGSAYLFSVDVAEEDCNGNGTPDVCELDEADCDGNRVPDICETLYFISASKPLGPFGAGMPASYTVGSLPPVSPQANTEVMVTVTAEADLNSLVEWIDVFVGGQMIGRLFEKDGDDCPLAPNIGQLAMPGPNFEALAVDGSVEIELVASFAVDPAFCPDSNVIVQLEYQATTDADCNGNAVPDICDIYINGTSEDENGNNIPDECESSCSEDVTGDREVDVDDLVEVILAWDQTGGPADVNRDGIVDVEDLVAIVLAWGPCA